MRNCLSRTINYLQNKDCRLFHILLFTMLLVGCAPKYVEVQDTSGKLEIPCYSVVPPPERNWHKLSPLLQTGCENRFKLASGGGSDIYWIFFISNQSPWKDKFDNKYLFEEAEKFIESEKNSLLLTKDLGVEEFTYEVRLVNGVKDSCVELKYEFVSSKPLSYKLGGMGSTGPTSYFGDNKLNPSDKYFYEFVEYHVIEGPYKPLIFSEAILYKVIFLHVSINENRDPELQEQAYKFLQNVELTTDWEKLERR